MNYNCKYNYHYKNVAKIGISKTMFHVRGINSNVPTKQLKYVVKRKVTYLKITVHFNSEHVIDKTTTVTQLGYTVCTILCIADLTLLICASKSSCPLVRTVFYDSASLVYTFTGLNHMYGPTHLKSYSSQDVMCAEFIRSLRCSSFFDSSVEDLILSVSCD